MYSFSHIVVLVTNRAFRKTYKLASAKALIRRSTLLLGLFLSVGVAGAAPVPLDDEIFQSSNILRSGVSCDSAGIITFHIEDVVSGKSPPYPGSFVEEGIIRFDRVTAEILDVEIHFEVFDKYLTKQVLS
jgi:hypothetical protein